MKPTFFVIGAAKAGTTTLCHHLATHPDVFVSARKELHFFSLETVYRRGLAWYESWFDGAGDASQRGEGSTSYSVRGVFPRAAERIAAYAPEARLIYLVRDPLARIESLWMQLRRLGATSPFADLGEPDVPPEMHVDLSFDRALRTRAEGLVDSTNYLRELEAYRAHFPDERILVLTFEELRDAPAATVRRAFAFLEVDPDAVTPDAGVHLNPMADYRHPHPLLWRLWSSPRRRRAYAAVAAAVPHPVRRWLNGNLLRRPVRERPAWEPATRAWVWERIGRDVERFADRYAIPRDAWRLPFGAATRD